MNNQPIIAHLDMDAFFASVEKRDNSCLRDKPVIVGADPQGGRGRGVVSTCCYQARSFGVHSAMPISQAYRRCPGAVFLRPAMDKYLEQSKEVYKILYSFSPHVRMVSIDEAFIDLSGSLHLFNNLEELTAEIKNKIKRKMQLPASIGVAPNSLVAKIASSRSKPDGALIVSKDKILDFLWPLDVASIPGVGPKTIKTLNFMGIKKIKDLAEADLYFLERNLGSFAYFLNKVANDGNFSYPCQVQSDKSISNEYTFKVDTSDIEAIKAKLMQLSRKISFRLRHKNIKANKLCLKVRFSNFKTKTKVFTFKRATNHFNTIYYQAKEGYQQWIKQGVRIRLLGIKVYRFISDDYQDFIFEDTEQERYEKLHNALKNIADKYGFGRVFLGVEKFKIKGKK